MLIGKRFIPIDNRIKGGKKKMRKTINIILIILLIYSFLSLFFYKNSVTLAASIENIMASIIVNGKECQGGNGIIDFYSNQPLILGKKYQEEVVVKNSGEIDMYTRIVIYKYFVDSSGNRLTSYSPDILNIHLANSDWLVDESANTQERKVLYYSKIVHKNEVTSNAIDYIMLDPTDMLDNIQFKKQEGQEGQTIISQYNYSKENKMVIEMKVEAVQTHSAVNAIKDAWNVDVSIDENGNLSLL